MIFSFYIIIVGIKLYYTYIVPLPHKYFLRISYIALSIKFQNF